MSNYFNENRAETHIQFKQTPHQEDSSHQEDTSQQEDPKQQRRKTSKKTLALSRDDRDEKKTGKEKRARTLEEIRQPILTSPVTKRDRQDEEKWENTAAQIQTKPGSNTPGRSPARQTMLGRFLINQTLEERRH